jgi:hypothetical protein
MWALWLALAVPPVGVALRAPGTKLIRSLPIASGTLAAWFFGFVLFVQLPFALLFQRGSGWLRAGASLALSMAATAILVSPRRTLVIVPLVLVFAPPSIGLAIGAPLAVWAAFVSWRDGAEPRSLVTVPFPRIAFLAIAMSLALALIRRERARLLLALVLLAVSRAVMSLEMLGIFSILAASVAVGAIGPVLARESTRLAWILPRPWFAHLVSLGIVLALTIPFCGARAIASVPILFFRGKSGTQFALYVIGWSIATTIVWRLACS